MPKIPEFRTGQNADQAHRALKESVGILDRAQHCAVLWFGEIMQRKLYRDLGFSSMRQYAIQALDFSSTRAGDFMRLAARLESLPVVKQEVATGRLGYTKAREIVAVADASTEKDWVRVAQKKSRRELEETVRLAKTMARQQRQVNPDQVELMPRAKTPAPPAASSVRVGFELSPTQYARYEAMLTKIGHRGSPAELLLELMETFLTTDESAPRGYACPVVCFQKRHIYLGDCKLHGYSYCHDFKFIIGLPNQGRLTCTQVGPSSRRSWISCPDASLADVSNDMVATTRSRPSPAKSSFGAWLLLS